MRRDVRLLGDVLGEVISESGGPDLLADVERLRHAVIDARRVPDRASARRPRPATRSPRWSAPGRGTAPNRSPAPSRSTSTWSTWPKSSSGCARCGSATRATRRRASRSPTRPSGSPPSRAALHLDALLAGLRVHPVFTAHPTEARRRAVVASLRRISGLLAVGRRRRGRGLRAAGRGASCSGGCARRSTCCGGPRSCGSPG